MQTKSFAYQMPKQNFSETVYQCDSEHTCIDCIKSRKRKLNQAKI